MSGTIFVPIAQAATVFTLDGTPSLVIQDTSNPANNAPLPVLLLNSAGEFGTSGNPIYANATVPGLPTSLGQKTMANSTSVAIASDQSAVPVSSTQLPSSLGSKLSAASLSVVFASDITGFPVTQSGTWNINNVSGTVSLPTGAATEATLATAANSLNNIDLNTADVATQTTLLTRASEATVSAINGKLNSLGQKVSASSMPVVLASDQSTIAIQATNLDIRDLTSASDSVSAAQSGSWNVGQSGTWNITNISGTVSLPTGAATEATLASVDSSASSIDGKMNSLGQKSMANSMPVTLASDQSAVSTVHSTASATTQTYGKIAFGSLTNSYATVITLSADAKILAIFSSLNTPVEISLNNGTTDFVELDGESLVVDLAAANLVVPSGSVIQARYSGSAPTSGSVRVSVLR